MAPDQIKTRRVVTWPFPEGIMKKSALRAAAFAATCLSFWLLMFNEAVAQYQTSTSATAATITENPVRSEEHTSELQSLRHLVCRLLLEKKKKKKTCSADNKNTDILMNNN